jgi:choice-of-anchor A domain-containing protein
VFELNDGDDGQAIFNPDLSITNIVDQLYADSAFFQSLNTTNTFDFGTFDSNSGELSYSGTDSTVVFNLDSDEAFAQNTNLRANLDFGSLDSVIINVSGTEINVGGGVNLNGFGNALNQAAGTTNVIWNFYEATSIDFNNIAVGGAVFDGAVAALSYTGAREFHNFVFNFDTPPVDVPEPATLSVMALGLIYVARRRKLNLSD